MDKKNTKTKLKRVTRSAVKNLPAGKAGQKAKISAIEFLDRTSNELLSLMGTKAKATVSEDKENDVLLVNVETADETGLLIGRHGDTLNSIQTILGMMLRQERGEWRRVVVNIGDWREKQESYLNDLAMQAAAKAKETGEPQPLYNLTPAQRRVVHLALSEDPEVETESQGEDSERFLLVRPKKK